MFTSRFPCYLTVLPFWSCTSLTSFLFQANRLYKFAIIATLLSDELYPRWNSVSDRVFWIWGFYDANLKSNTSIITVNVTTTVLSEKRRVLFFLTFNAEGGFKPQYLLIYLSTICLASVAILKFSPEWNAFGFKINIACSNTSLSVSLTTTICLCTPLTVKNTSN